MRVLIASNTPNDMRLGVARIMHHIGNELLKRNHSVDYVHASDVPQYIPHGRLPALNYSLGLVQAIRQKENTTGAYDVVNIYGGDGCFYGLAKKLLGKENTFVVTVHGSEEYYWDQWHLEQNLGLAPKRTFKASLSFHFLRSTQNRLALKTSDRILCASYEADKEFIADQFSIDREKIGVVPNGVGEEYFITRDYESESPSLLMVGTWIWRKGIRYLVPAFEQVHSMHPNTQLCVIGTMIPPEQVRNDFPKHVRHRIQVIPSLPNDKMLEEYRKHSIFVLPSLVEGMPLAMLEAMATGMPVVVTDTCGMHDFVQAEHNGLLVPCRDSEALAHAMSRLIQDKSLRRTLGTNAQAKMRHYTWELVANLWWNAMMNVGKK